MDNLEALSTRTDKTVVQGIAPIAPSVPTPLSVDSVHSHIAGTACAPMFMTQPRPGRGEHSKTPRFLRRPWGGICVHSGI